MEIGRQPGFTLIEILFTVAIVSAALLVIFPSFYRSADTLVQLSGRYRAGLLLENVIAEAERDLREDGEVPPAFSKDRIDLAGMEFSYEVRAVPIHNHGKLYELKALCRWEGPRKYQLSRTALIQR